MYFLAFIVFEFLVLSTVAIISYNISNNNTSFFDMDWSGITFFASVLSIISFLVLCNLTYKDLNVKLISQNKISAQFEINSSRFWGFIYDTEIKNVYKFTTDSQTDELKYKDRYFILMKLAGQDISKYADVTKDKVIYRMTPLQELEIN